MTFLFDIGNVLLKLHFENFHTAVLGSPDASLPDELNSLKDPYETGRISDEQFVTRSLEILDRKLSREEFIGAWEDIFSPNTPMWDLAAKLRQDGHRLILFSNTNALHAKRFLADYPVFTHFHHHHFSQEIGAIKPHPDFYQQAVDTYKLIARDTVYLDDLPENIQTGKDFGFKSWQYDHRNHQACLDWLAKITT